MKPFKICLFLLLGAVSPLFAQEIDTLPIETKGLEIKLKRSPIPVRITPMVFKPVQILPVVVDEKVNYWKTTTQIGVDVNQGSFSKNWKAGGVNSFAVGGMLNYRTAYSKEGYSYTSEVRLEYGKIKNKDQLQKKTKDRIFWDNKAGLQLSKSWFFFGSVTLETQFDAGYAYYREEGEEKSSLISKFMSPGYLTESIGFEYKPVPYFSTRIGTGTAKQTFMLDTTVINTRFNNGNYGLRKREGARPPQTFRNELAFQVTSELRDKEIFKNVFLYARYNMFIPYDRQLEHIDHRLDVTLKSQINKFMRVQINGVGLFDKDADREIQASQNLSLGFGFTFPR
ncbi:MULTISPECIES: DUF3078 domain-containing protein [Pedobacter]|uniref:DUF3078 domain-containing protein n=1 Tax=Pedobacter TaxID=84567 RepID=UPI00210C8E1C|nr:MULTISPECIES: DUF3078 domain-containing protein [unclassified Pedobacter]